MSSNIMDNDFKCDKELEGSVVIKKDGTSQPFMMEKAVAAISKSADRVMVQLDKDELDKFCTKVANKVKQVFRETHEKKITIRDMHKIVESSLEDINENVANSYREYRNYKINFVGMMDRVYKEANQIMYLGDRNNANTDATLVSTKRSLTYSALNKELYKKFFLNVDELQAINDGYIYIHDMSARRDSFNCCIADIASILDGGFEMANQWYNEPKTLATAFDVIGDIVLSAASQQYGGFTIPEVDKILSKYAKLSYDKYIDELTIDGKKQLDKTMAVMKASGVDETTISAIKAKMIKKIDTDAKKKAIEKVRRDYQQGFQGWEYKFNTVGSSRGDYPFIACTFGLGTDKFEQMASIEMCKVRAGGQGKAGFKRLVLFPKLIFLYDSKLHGEGKKNREVYLEGLKCSSKAMYPDWLSLEPGSYVGDMYQKYGTPISPMGKCKCSPCKTFRTLVA